MRSAPPGDGTDLRAGGADAATETTGVECLARRAKANVGEMRPIRKDIAGMMRRLNASDDLARRSELRDGLEPMTGTESGGAPAPVRTTIEGILARIGNIVRRAGLP